MLLKRINNVVTIATYASIISTTQQYNKNNIILFSRYVLVTDRHG